MLQLWYRLKLPATEVDDEADGADVVDEAGEAVVTSEHDVGAPGYPPRCCQMVPLQPVMLV